MKNWEDFYAKHPLQFERSEYLKQVGHTFQGKPISDEQFARMVNQIAAHLALEENDILLDLCCGNGLITRELAGRCRKVVGVDFSEPLIEIANAELKAENVTYHKMSVLELDEVLLMKQGPFTKIMMYAALQHFKPSDFESILKGLIRLSVGSPCILFGFVPDRKRKGNFYNTWRRKVEHIYRRIAGNDLLGTWWDERFVRKICDKMGLQCSTHEVDESLHANIYRFDIRISD